MGPFKRSFIAFSLISSAYFHSLAPGEEPKNDVRCVYFLKAHDVAAAMDIYLDKRHETGIHDFARLEEMALFLLNEGANSENPQEQLASIYGIHLAGIAPPFEVLAQGIASKAGDAQQASLQLAALFQDDLFDELLLRAMSSSFLPIRLEAGFYLSQKKHPAAAGHLEALFARIPPFFRFVFPEFFAIIGTKEAVSILRTLMDDEEMSCKTEAILSAGRYQRDDLLSVIRKKITHPSHALQEAASNSLMMLRDLSSVPRLKELLKSPSSFVQLSAARALLSLGLEEAQAPITSLLTEGNVYAMHVAGEMRVELDHLAELVKHKELQIRINAGIALLQARDPRGVPAILEILLSDMRDLGIFMISSPGRSLHAWKIVPSLSQHAEFKFADPKTITLSVREHLLKSSLELGEKAFLDIAKMLVAKKEHALIPLLSSLLENLRTEESLKLLREMAGTAGSPLMRSYAALSLFRLKDKGPYEGMLRNWLDLHATEDILKFRPTLPFHARAESSSYELTPEEVSRLLFGIYQAFADEHSVRGMDLLVNALRNETSLNRYALAGLLLRTLQ